MRTVLRVGLLCLLCLFWAYGSSVFSPWAESSQPRLWLYDTLFYSGAALLFWGVGELLYLVKVARESHRFDRVIIPLIFLLIAASAALSYYTLHHTGLGWQWRIQLSAEALEPYRSPDFSDRRHRVGWLLIDTMRAPCGHQPWLWLGRPFGGATGINLALVYSPEDLPETPQPEAFRFLPVHGGWWMAYQNPHRYRQSLDRPERCDTGTPTESHRAGNRFIEVR